MKADVWFFDRYILRINKINKLNEVYSSFSRENSSFAPSLSALKT